MTLGQRDLGFGSSKFTWFDLSKKGGVGWGNIYIEVKPTFKEEIKANQFQDEDLNKLRNKIVFGETQDTNLDARGVLSFRERICVPQIGHLI